MALRAFIAASFLVVAGLCRAQGSAYTAGGPAADGTQAIYLLNLSARTATPIGSVGSLNGTPITAVSGLTIGTDKALYAVTGTGGSASLLTLNTLNGKASFVSQLRGIDAATAPNLSMSFDCDGNLWMASSSSNNLWQITPGSGDARSVGNLGVKITGLAFRDKVLYGIGGAGNGNLYTIATDTAKATAIGGGYGVNVPNPIDASFDGSGTLWSLLRNFNGNLNNGLPNQLNSLGQINPKSGAMNTVGTIAEPQTKPLFPTPMSGLAISSPSCSSGGVDPPPPAVGAPSLSLAGLGTLVLSLLAGAGIAYRRQRSH